MKCSRYYLIICVVILINSISQGQSILKPEDAVRHSLENNFDVKIAKNDIDIAANSTSKYNTGKLPTVALNGGYTFNLDNTTANFQDGRSTTLTFAPSQGVNANVNASYVIFDGFFRKYRIEQLNEQVVSSQLALDAAFENIAAQTLIQYYQLAALSQNLGLIEEAIKISAERLNRAKEYFDFGRGNRLDILNAEVDLNNDSLNYYSTQIEIDNAKRALLNLTLHQSSIDFDVESDLVFTETLIKSRLKDQMLEENIALSQLDQNVHILGLNTELAKARKLPSLVGNLGYGYNFNMNNPASFLSSINNNGLTANLSLSWNIFDGGQSKHDLEQIRLQEIGLDIQRGQLVQQLELDFENAWANYENSKFIYQNQIRQVEINQANFERSQAQFEIGQISSIDYRQAQLNLLNAQVALNNAKFQVKIAEIGLLLLSGNILE